MQVPTFRYLRWFKERAPHARISLAQSGMGVPPESILPLHSLSWRLDVDDMDGYAPLQERIATHLGVSADRVAVLPGCTCATHLAARALIDEGDAVAVESPTYELLVRLAEMSGAQVRRLPRPPERSFQLSMELVEKTFMQGSSLLLLTVPHNPSGRMLGDLEVAELAALAENHDARILADEVYLDFFPRKLRSYPSLAAVSERFITTGSLTKTHGLANLRVGWAAGPPEVASAIRRLNEYYSDRIPAFDAQAAVLAFDRMEELLQRAHRVRETNWPILSAWAEGLQGVEVLDPGAGITAVLRIPEAIDSLALAEGILERDGVLVCPAEMFGSHGFLRISYGIDKPDLQEGLGAVKDALARAGQRV